MTSAGLALQTAIFAVLTGDSELTALLGGARVYDTVPRGVDFPYVTFGSSSSRDWSTGSEDGEELTVTLHVWSQASGNRQVQRIIARLRALLHDASLTLSEHRLVNLRHEISETRRNDGGESYRGLARFRAVTEPVP